MEECRQVDDDGTERELVNKAHVLTLLFVLDGKIDFVVITSSIIMIEVKEKWE